MPRQAAALPFEMLAAREPLFSFMIWLSRILQRRIHKRHQAMNAWGILRLAGIYNTN